MKKILWPGIISGAVILILSMGISCVFMSMPSVVADYNNAHLMRTWRDPLISLFFVYPFLLGLALAWAWDKSKALFEGSAWNRGTNFGLAYFVISAIPGMMVTFGSFPLSLLTIVCWTESCFISAVAVGWILANMNA